MKEQDKQLLLKDLCTRVPYGVKINIRNDYTLSMEDIELNAYQLTTASYDIEFRGLRPYLRPMSSMTKEEENKYINTFLSMWDAVDWLLAHHFDFRGLIEKGLALEAPEGMYL